MLGLFTNKSQQVVEWNVPPRPCRNSGMFPYVTHFVPKLRYIYIYIIMYVYTFIVTSAKLNLFVGNYLKSCLRKCFKEKVSAKKICTPFFTVSHKMKTKLGGASKDSFMFTPNPWGNDPI